MDPNKTALDLLSCLDKEKAIKHCDFVLSPGYGLLKQDLRRFWEDVKSILTYQN